MQQSLPPVRLHVQTHRHTHAPILLLCLKWTSRLSIDPWERRKKTYPYLQIKHAPHPRTDSAALSKVKRPFVCRPVREKKEDTTPLPNEKSKILLPVRSLPCLNTGIPSSKHGMQMLIHVHCNDSAPVCCKLSLIDSKRRQDIWFVSIIAWLPAYAAAAADNLKEDTAQYSRFSTVQHLVITWPIHFRPACLLINFTCPSMSPASPIYREAAYAFPTRCWTEAPHWTCAH